LADGDATAKWCGPARVQAGSVAAVLDLHFVLSDRRPETDRHVGVSPTHFSGSFSIAVSVKGIRKTASQASNCEVAFMGRLPDTFVFWRKPIQQWSFNNGFRDGLGQWRRIDTASGQ
jgi:hypothetical protein